MKLKTYLFAIFSITLLSLGVWLLIFFNVDRDVADFITISAFFGSLFLWLAGFLTLIIFYLRVWFSNKEVVFSNLPISIRHAILIALIIVGLLALNALQVLTWWDAGMYLVVVVLLELFFRSKKVS